ncbi:hypothetical protein GCM10028819_36770 [Spirosoma humi]
MKTAKPNIKLLLYGFCLATVLYNCKTKDVDSLTPFTYTFKGFTDVKLPDVTPTAPAAVTVTAASITSSTAAAAVSAGLSSMSATGQIPASVQQASDNVGKAVTADKASAIVAEFTPAVISNLSATGALPASLQAEVKTIANNSAIQAYLPTFTLPQVNGKTVGGRLAAGGIVATVATTYGALDNDACKAAATAAFNTALQGLDAAKQAQTATVTTQFTQLQTTIQADATACKSSKPATYDAYRALATQQLNQGLAALGAVRSILGEDSYNLLTVLYYVAYAQAIVGIGILQTADTTACDTIATAKLANAQTARDKDLSTINSNYNATISTLTATRDQAIKSCHNQGNGG